MTLVLTQPRTTDNGSGTTPPMLHRIDPKRKTHALCGMKITKAIGPIKQAECVVCEDLWKQMWK